MPENEKQINNLKIDQFKQRLSDQDFVHCNMS